MNFNNCHFALLFVFCIFFFDDSESMWHLKKNTEVKQVSDGHQKVAVESKSTNANEIAAQPGILERLRNFAKGIIDVIVKQYTKMKTKVAKYKQQTPQMDTGKANEVLKGFEEENVKRQTEAPSTIIRFDANSSDGKTSPSV